MPRAIDHIALIVGDPARTARLFCDLFADASASAAETDRDGHEETELLLGGVSFVLVRGQGPVAPNGDHIAFAVSKAEQLACAEKLRELGMAYQMARGDTALYFSDYDNHVFELDVGEL
jgi:hypothetical protein